MRRVPCKSHGAHVPADPTRPGFRHATLFFAPPLSSSRSCPRAEAQRGSRGRRARGAARGAHGREAKTACGSAPNPRSATGPALAGDAHAFGSRSWLGPFWPRPCGEAPGTLFIHSTLCGETRARAPAGSRLLCFKLLFIRGNRRLTARAPARRAPARVTDVFFFVGVRGEAGAAGAVPLALQAPARVAQMAAAAAHAAAAAGPHGMSYSNTHAWGGGAHCSEPGAAAQAAAAGSRAARMFLYGAPLRHSRRSPPHRAPEWHDR